MIKKNSVGFINYYLSSVVLRSQNVSYSCLVLVMSNIVSFPVKKMGKSIFEFHGGKNNVV